jgi:tetratricopeptide (TPR) repeat protein/2-polyprenyl-3-methyl-5-hydroxy-6-metoxy-1,4-benzoquinol methylase
MGEKKRRAAAQPPAPLPGQAPSPGLSQSDGRLVARAFEALSAGDRVLAARNFDALVANLPADAEVLSAIGVLGLQLGEPQRALGPLVRAREQSPRDAGIRCHLAIAYRSVGQPDLAVTELETAISIDPTLAEPHSNLGNLLLERGDNEAAEASFERALALSRDYPFALFGRGEAKLAQGRDEEAGADFERAIALDPALHEARYGLSRACSAIVARLERADPAAAKSSVVVKSADSALESIVAALQQERDNAAYWTQFEHCVKEFDLSHPADSRVRDLLFRALGHTAVDPARLVKPVASLIATRPDAVEFRRRLQASAEGVESAWPGLVPLVGGLLDDALLRRLLEAVVVPNLFIERLVTFARAGLLRDATSALSAEPALPLAAIVAMAHQCFNCEYVHDEASPETAAVLALSDTIAERRAASAPVPLHVYAIYACYRPLHTLGDSAAIAEELSPTALSSLATRQIREPHEESLLRATIPALTEVAGAVSTAVRDQYEENPYPRWLRMERDVAQMSVAAFLRTQFPQADLAGLPEDAARILIAGCGTGRHPIGTARRFPRSSVLAIDLSLASLAYAKRKTRELGIGNIEYRQADLLALSGHPERYDVVDCTGVLHHLEDPVAGWKILRSLLRPGGMMRVGLYSEMARRHVVRARELIAAEKFAPTPEGIRACRAAILARESDPLLARVARGEDFYSLSGCRDLLFHVQEQRFTLPGIASILDELDLQFVGFEWADNDAPARYRARFPGDLGLSNLDNWHALEQDRPDTFVLMYQFWVRRPR